MLTFALLFGACEIVSPSSDPCREAIAPPEGPVGYWEFLGLKGEVILSVSVDPCNPNVILAGSLFSFSDGRHGKLFRSSDGGTTWDTLRVGGNYIEILFDPEDPRTAYASVFPTPGVSNYGVLKSTDGGRRWTFMNEGLRLDSYTGVTTLAVDPENSQVLYAGTGGRFGGWLYRSDNGGRLWVPVEEKEDSYYMVEGILDIAFDPNDPNTVYVPTGFGSPLLKSTDRGSSWKETGLSGANLPGLVDEVLVLRGNSNVVFAAIGWGGAYRSVDRGVTWTAFNGGLPDSVAASDLEWDDSMEDLYAVAYSHQEGAWVYKLDSTGEAWSKLDTGIHGLYGGHDLFLDGNSSMLYFGVDGVYRYRIR